LGYSELLSGNINNCIHGQNPLQENTSGTERGYKTNQFRKESQPQVSNEIRSYSK
jgi:hypothetical protein